MLSALKQLQLSYRYLKHCRRILDVGCGTGEFIKLNSQQISGVDSNRQTVMICRRKGLPVKLGKADRLPFPAASFDGVHSSHMIEHLPPATVHTFLNEAGRVLKPGGILVISTPLLWSGFYDNLTHLKPYPPRALLRYLVEEATDTTFSRLKYRFVFVALWWRRQWFTKTGYTLVVRKQ